MADNNQTEEVSINNNEILVSIKNDKIKIATFAISILAIIISSISVYITIHFAFPTKKEEIRVEYREILSISSEDSVIWIGQHVNFRNYGNLLNTISSIKAFVVSRSSDSQGKKHFQRYFSDVWCGDSPFLGYILAPYNAWNVYFNFYQKEFLDYPNRFEEGTYDYLIFYDIDNARYVYSCYEFTVNKDQVDSILSGKIEYIDLKRINDQQRMDELVKIWNAFK